MKLVKVNISFLNALSDYKSESEKYQAIRHSCYKPE